MDGPSRNQTLPNDTLSHACLCDVEVDSDNLTCVHQRMSRPFGRPGEYIMRVFLPRTGQSSPSRVSRERAVFGSVSSDRIIDTSSPCLGKVAVRL